MKVLITGVSGLLGLNVALEAAARHDVVGVHRGRIRSAPFETLESDLLRADAVERLLDSVRPDCVIHCAALADVDRCEVEPEQARELNTELPDMIARACRARSINLVHISTDAVFGGDGAGPYTEDDVPRPVNVYGATKLRGERAVLAAFPEAIVARVNFYGWSLSGDRSLAEFFINNLRAGNPVLGFTDVVFCPMLANQLARLVLEMVEKRLAGLFHVVGPEPMSKYEFGVAVARRWGLDAGRISPRSVAASDLAAPRTRNLHLSTHKLSTALGTPLPAFSTGLDEFYAQSLQGYPQMIRGFSTVEEEA